MAKRTCSVPGCSTPHNGRGHPNPAERFWSYVDKDGPGGCWLWTGGVERNGYARFRHNGSRTGVHRYSYELLVGPIPDGLTIDHLCGVRTCVNPTHLEAVTSRENTRRREDLQGEAHGCASLTEPEVLDIKRALANGRNGIGRALARQYGVSVSTISAINVGRRWSHLDVEEPA